MSDPTEPRRRNQVDIANEYGDPELWRRFDRWLADPNYRSSDIPDEPYYDFVPEADEGAAS